MPRSSRARRRPRRRGAQHSHARKHTPGTAPAPSAHSSPPTRPPPRPSAAPTPTPTPTPLHLGQPTSRARGRIQCRLRVMVICLSFGLSQTTRPRQPNHVDSIRRWRCWAREALQKARSGALQSGQSVHARTCCGPHLRGRGSTQAYAYTDQILT